MVARNVLGIVIPAATVAAGLGIVGYALTRKSGGGGPPPPPGCMCINASGVLDKCPPGYGPDPVTKACILTSPPIKAQKNIVWNQSFASMQPVVLLPYGLQGVWALRAVFGTVRVEIHGEFTEDVTPPGEVAPTFRVEPFNSNTALWDYALPNNMVDFQVDIPVQLTYADLMAGAGIVLAITEGWHCVFLRGCNWHYHVGITRLNLQAIVYGPF